MPTQPFFSSGKRQRLYFTLSYIWNLDVSEQVRMMKDSLVNIIAACLCHKLCVSSCWGMCQRFVSAARDSSCSGHWPSHQVQCLSAVTRPSVSVSIIELKFLQSMSGSVTNQRKVNNVQQAVWVPADQSAATVRAD